MRLYGRTTTATVALTVDTNAYTANDVVGGLITFDVESAGGGGLIMSASIVDDDNEKAALDLYLFDAVPTAIADDAAFAPAIADLKKFIGKISFAAGDYETINSNAVALLGEDNTALPIAYSAVTTGKLYGYLVCTGTPTYTAATDVTVRLTVIQD